MTTILYLPLVNSRRGEEAILRFPAIARVPCKVKAVGKRIHTKLLPALLEAKSIAAAAADVTELLTGQKLMVLCSPHARIASLTKAACPTAVWGARIANLALAYYHEPAVVWHEMFHLLGARDCYGTTAACGRPRCIMQYAPSLHVVGDPPFMCQANIRRIKRNSHE